MNNTSITPPWHFGTRYAGQTLNWWPTDTEESFERMVQDPVHKDYFEQQGWLEPDGITYRINQQGFRGDDFDSESPTLLALGCSFTMGIGLSEHQAWPWLVGQALGLRVATIAHGGWSADACFRMSEYWIPALRPKLVIMMAPPARLELHTTDPSNPVENIMVDQPPWNKDMFIKNWFTIDENSRLNSVRNRYAVQGLCNSLNIPCLTYDSTKFFVRSREDVGYARDYMHAGPLGHRMAKEQMLNDQTRLRHSIS